MNDRMIMLVRVARISLAFLWIFSGLTSLIFSPETGYKILANAGITDLIADVFVIGGSTVDIMLGIWVLSSKWLRLCCIVQIVTIVIYTLLLTIISGAFWLHPFGPLTKNIPIVVLILIVYSASDK